MKRLVREKRISLLLLSISLLLLLASCMGSNLKKSSQIDVSRLKYVQSLHEKIEVICSSPEIKPDALYFNQLCDNQVKLSSSLFLLASKTKDLALNRPSNIRLGIKQFQVKYDEKDGYDHFTIWTHRFIPSLIPASFQSIANYFKQLLHVKGKGKGKGKKHFFAGQDPKYDLEKGIFTTSFRFYYDQEDTLVANFDNTIHIEARKVSDAIMVTFEIKDTDIEFSLIKRAKGKLLILPIKQGVFLSFWGHVDMPNYGLPSYFSREIKRIAEDLYLNLRDQILKKSAKRGSKENQDNQEKQEKQEDQNQRYFIQTVSYKGKIYSQGFDNPICEGESTATINNRGIISLKWEHLTCLKGLKISAENFFSLDGERLVDVIRSKYDPRKFPDYQLLSRSADVTITKKIATSTGIGPLFYPPKIVAIHPIIQDPSIFVDYSFTQETTLYDPVIAKGQTTGITSLVVHEVDKVYYSEILDRKFEHIIHFSIVNEGYPGTFKMSYMLFDRMEFYWSYRPVLVPKLVVYGNFSQYVGENPGLVTRTLLEKVRVEIELTEIISRYEN